MKFILVLLPLIQCDWIMASGCSVEPLEEWYSERIKSPHLIQCADGSCRAICSDSNDVNEKSLFALKGDEWDGVCKCIDRHGWWCPPKEDVTYECYDLPCKGMKHFVDMIAPGLSKDVVEWRCAEGACSAKCGDTKKKAVMHIGNAKFDMLQLTCHNDHIHE